jgi:hypothetical protein
MLARVTEAVLTAVISATEETEDGVFLCRGWKAFGGGGETVVSKSSRVHRASGALSSPDSDGFFFLSTLNHRLNGEPCGFVGLSSSLSSSRSTSGLCSGVVGLEKVTTSSKISPSSLPTAAAF